MRAVSWSDFDLHGLEKTTQTPDIASVELGTRGRTGHAASHGDRRPSDIKAQSASRNRQSI